MIQDDEEDLEAWPEKERVSVLFMESAETLSTPDGKDYFEVADWDVKPHRQRDLRLGRNDARNGRMGRDDTLPERFEIET